MQWPNPLNQFAINSVGSKPFPFSQLYWSYAKICIKLTQKGRDLPLLAAGSKKDKEISRSPSSPGTVGAFVSLQEQENLLSEMQNYLKMLPCTTTKVEEQLRSNRVVELSQFLKYNPGSTALAPAQSWYPVGMGAAFFSWLSIWFILVYFGSSPAHVERVQICASSCCRDGLQEPPIISWDNMNFPSHGAFKYKYKCPQSWKQGFASF